MMALSDPFLDVSNDKDLFRAPSFRRRIVLAVRTFASVVFSSHVQEHSIDDLIQYFQGEYPSSSVTNRRVIPLRSIGQENCLLVTTITLIRSQFDDFKCLSRPSVLQLFVTYTRKLIIQGLTMVLKGRDKVALSLRLVLHCIVIDDPCKGTR